MPSLIKKSCLFFHTGDAVEGTNGEESREAEDAAVPAEAAAETTTAVTENGASAEAEHHVNGNGKTDENAEADCKSRVEVVV